MIPTLKAVAATLVAKPATVEVLTNLRYSVRNTVKTMVVTVDKGSFSIRMLRNVYPKNHVQCVSSVFFLLDISVN